MKLNYSVLSSICCLYLAACSQANFGGSEKKRAHKDQDAGRGEVLSEKFVTGQLNDFNLSIGEKKVSGQVSLQQIAVERSGVWKSSDLENKFPHGIGISEIVATQDLDQRAEVFVKLKEDSVDFLFVIDNSPSMQELQAFGDAVTATGSPFASNGILTGKSWRVAIVTTDISEANRTCVKQVIRHSDSNAAEKLKNAIKTIATNGSENERPLVAAAAALTNCEAFNHVASVPLGILFVSDEDAREAFVPNAAFVEQDRTPYLNAVSPFRRGEGSILGVFHWQEKGKDCSATALLPGIRYDTIIDNIDASYSICEPQLYASNMHDFASRSLGLTKPKRSDVEAIVEIRNNGASGSQLPLNSIAIVGNTKSLDITHAANVVFGQLVWVRFRIKADPSQLVNSFEFNNCEILDKLEGKLAAQSSFQLIPISDYSLSKPVAGSSLSRSRITFAPNSPWISFGAKFIARCIDTVAALNLPPLILANALECKIGPQGSTPSLAFQAFNHDAITGQMKLVPPLSANALRTPQDIECSYTNTNDYKRDYRIDLPAQASSIVAKTQSDQIVPMQYDAKSATASFDAINVIAQRQLNISYEAPAPEGNVITLSQLPLPETLKVMKDEQPCQYQLAEFAITLTNECYPFQQLDVSFSGLSALRRSFTFDDKRFSEFLAAAQGRSLQWKVLQNGEALDTGWHVNSSNSGIELEHDLMPVSGSGTSPELSVEVSYSQE